MPPDRRRRSDEEFAHEQRHRPAVEHDVVVGEREDGALLGEPDEDGAQQRRMREIEAGEAFGVEERLQVAVRVG